MLLYGSKAGNLNGLPYIDCVFAYIPADIRLKQRSLRRFVPAAELTVAYPIRATL